MKKNKDVSFGQYIKNGIRTEKSIIRLNIQEIDEELSLILNLPTKPVQKYWNLQKIKQEKLRKLKKTGF